MEQKHGKINANVINGLRNSERSNYTTTTTYSGERKTYTIMQIEILQLGKYQLERDRIFNSFDTGRGFCLFQDY